MLDDATANDCHPREGGDPARSAHHRPQSGEHLAMVPRLDPGLAASTVLTVSGPRSITERCSTAPPSRGVAHRCETPAASAPSATDAGAGCSTCTPRRCCACRRRHPRNVAADAPPYTRASPRRPSADRSTSTVRPASQPLRRDVAQSLRSSSHLALAAEPFGSFKADVQPGPCRLLFRGEYPALGRRHLGATPL